jgi:hypothetical protein
MMLCLLRYGNNHGFAFGGVYMDQSSINIVSYDTDLYTFPFVITIWTDTLTHSETLIVKVPVKLHSKVSLQVVQLYSYLRSIFLDTNE